MKMLKTSATGLIGLLIACGAVPSYATVTIKSLMPSAAPPQPIGKTIVWSVKATDTNPGPLTFQFTVTPPGGTPMVVIDFNTGNLKSGTWNAQPFVWVPNACAEVTEASGVVALTCQGIEGAYQIQVVAKDFTTGESATKTGTFQINSLLTGTNPVVTATGNPLVALFSSPSCPSGSFMRVNFQQQSLATPATWTNWVPCHPPTSMNFEIAGMYASTAYNMFAQTNTGGTFTNGPTVTYTTGAVSSKVPIPAVTVNIPAGAQSDTTDPVLLSNPSAFGGMQVFANVATDLSGKLLWYYFPAQPITLTRPLLNGTMLTIQSAQAWNKSTTKYQILQQVDLAGNIVRQTNTGIIQQQLLAKGAKDGGPCSAIASPAPVGSACLGAFHHDAVQSFPNGYTAVIADIEKIFAPGTQGDKSGLPVDIIGAMIVVLDQNWQVAWYFDAFQHAGGAPQLDINRVATLGETCIANESGCPPMFLLGSGIAPKAYDWLHPNSIYYWPQTKDIIWSVKDQDWIVKIDYNNGTGSANILWRLGKQGDFSFMNVNSDPYPWFSHQHEVGIENNGAGPMSIFDNGDTRISMLGSPGCQPNDCNSRGMALTIDETAMTATPVLSQDLTYYSSADGSAQLLSNGNYFFQPGVVLDPALLTDVAYILELLPTTGTVNATQVLNLQSSVSYRSWQMSSLYNPPIT